MPKFDGTGPEGNGSRSGRGLGKCSARVEKDDSQNNSQEKEMGKDAGARCGKGRGQGGRRGR